MINNFMVKKKKFSYNRQLITIYHKSLVEKITIYNNIYFCEVHYKNKSIISKYNKIQQKWNKYEEFYYYVCIFNCLPNKKILYSGKK